MRRFSVSIATIVAAGTVSAESVVDPDCYALRAFQFSAYLSEAIAHCHPDQTEVITAVSERKSKLKVYLLKVSPDGETAIEERRKNARLPNPKDCTEAEAEGMGDLIQSTEVTLKSWDVDMEFHFSNFPDADWTRCLD